jgi:hypothetical protein
MYIINKSANRIEKIESTTFKELGLREREHLQEWIAHNPSCLNNEELLIIQKEFDGFNDTNERLDLLALDKQGNLVLIENKLDDTGRDVTWQVIKYASYCSTLNAAQIISIYQQHLDKWHSGEKSESRLEEFFETEDFKERLNVGNSQRLMMVAGEFRKEVTSSVLWLMNFGLRIQCFKATPYKLSEQLLLNIEQIIPMKEAEEFIISMANKTREELGAQDEMKERHHIRKKFWAAYLKEINKVSPLYQNVSPSKDNWISAGSGISGIVYNSVATRDYIRIELTMYGGTQQENKVFYDSLKARESQIEASFGDKLIWERLNDKRMSRIKYELEEVSISNEDDWDKMISFMTIHVPKFEAAFKKHIHEVGKLIKNTMNHNL